jgi:two-component system LytT family response regulator
MKTVSNKETSKANTLVCKTAEGLVFINLDDIICLKADRHFTQIFIVDREKSIKVMSNISSLIPELSQNAFIQCHRSYIINTRHISHYRQKCKELVMKKNITVPVSKSYEKKLLKIFL